MTGRGPTFVPITCQMRLVRFTRNCAPKDGIQPRRSRSPCINGATLADQFRSPDGRPLAFTAPRLRRWQAAASRGRYGLPYRARGRPRPSPAGWGPNTIDRTLLHLSAGPSPYPLGRPVLNSAPPSLHRRGFFPVRSQGSNSSQAPLSSPAHPRRERPNKKEHRWWRRQRNSLVWRQSHSGALRRNRLLCATVCWGLLGCPWRRWK